VITSAGAITGPLQSSLRTGPKLWQTALMIAAPVGVQTRLRRHRVDWFTLQQLSNCGRGSEAAHGAFQYAGTDTHR